MNSLRFVAVVLIVAGALGLAYGGFSYTSETHKAEIGSLELSVDEKEHVNVPMWAGVGVLILGVVLLVVPKKA